MSTFENKQEIPMGLGMALAQNPEAMAYFASLTPQHQMEVIQRTHQIRSKQEMREFVELLPNNHLI